MYKVTISAGGVRGMTIKVASFATKEDAVTFVTEQLNKLLSNPAVKKWDISCAETSVVSIH